MKLTRVYFVASAGRPADFPTYGQPEIAFVCRSNVGKSSLINSLVSVKGLARTSQTPGKTQTINFFRANESFYLVDLPGYGYAKVPQTVRKQWQQLIESYLINRSTLRLVILIVDVRHEPSEADIQMKGWLEHYGIPYRIVATKADKLSNNQRRQAEKVLRTGLANDQVILYSAVTGLGKADVWQAIQARLRAPASEPS